MKMNPLERNVVAATSSLVKQHYQDKAVAAAYDRQRFSSLTGRLFDTLEKRAIRSLVRKVLRYSRQPTVLDIPCGTGRITELLLQMDLQVLGGDISEPMLTLAGEKCARFGRRAAFRRLDLDDLDMPADSFDLVTCVRLMHHLDTEAREAIFKQLARVARRFVLVNVSFSSPFYRFRRRVKRMLGRGVSKQSSTWRQIQRETAAAGLEVFDRRFILPLASEDLVLLMRKK